MTETFKRGDRVVWADNFWNIWREGRVRDVTKNGVLVKIFFGFFDSDNGWHSAMRCQKVTP